jgi:hypothetical protein
LKINIIAIIGAVIALIGLVLPWWTMSLSGSSLIPPITLQYSASIYLYQTTASGVGTSVTGPMNFWYGWVAFILLVLGALFGLAGGMLPARAILVIGGILALLSVIIFAAGLQNDLTRTSSLSGIGLFSSGSFLGYSYTSYLSFGFWLALIGAILMLTALLKKSKAGPPTVVPPAQQEQEKPSTTPS